MTRAKVLLVLLSLICVAPTLRAHDPGLSTLKVVEGTERIDVCATFARKEIEAWIVSREKNVDWRERATALAPTAVVLKKVGTAITPTQSGVTFDDQQNVEFRLAFELKGEGKLTVHSPFINGLAPGHRQLFTVLDAKGAIVTERLLKADADFAEFEFQGLGGDSEPYRTASFFGFLGLGVKHILMGYDHLLFLFVLLIVAPGLRSSLGVITCFTVAHSITLALATFNLVQFPSRIVEAIIAASIIYVSVENLVRRGETPRRWLLTFVFGLVHGLGFASVLRDLGVGAAGSGIALPLLSFNLGVELGQIMVAAVLLPILWKAKEQPAFVRRWMPACSMLAVLAGSWWLVQRVWFGA